MTGRFSEIQYLGAGIGLREEIADDTLANKTHIEVLEIISDKFIGESRSRSEFLKRFAGKFPIIPHGIDLSLGSATELDFEYLKRLKTLCNFIGATYYSEHFAVTKLPGINIGHLSPLWFTKESLELVVRKIHAIQEFLGLPLALENITSDFEIQEADFEEPEFISEVCKRTSCGLLLDLANVHINSYNRKRDPYAFLARLPLKNVIQIHLAGGVVERGWFHDTHSTEMDGPNAGIWKILEWTIPHVPNLKAIIIERDANFRGGFAEILLADLARARKIMVRPIRPAQGRQAHHKMESIRAA